MLCVRCLCAFCVAALYCVLAGGLEEQTEEGQLSGVATRHAKKNKAQQRRTLILHLPLTLNFTPAPHPPPSTLPPTPPPPNPPTPCKTRRETKTNETKFEFKIRLSSLKIRNTSEHKLSTTHYIIQIFSIQHETNFCHLFNCCPIPTRGFFCIGKKRCFLEPKKGKCLDAR